MLSTVAFCSMVLDSLCSLRDRCLIFFEALLMGFDAALGMALILFCRSGKKDRAPAFG